LPSANAAAGRACRHPWAGQFEKTAAARPWVKSPEKNTVILLTRFEQLAQLSKLSHLKKASGLEKGKKGPGSNTFSVYSEP
jgi:hypothetical protein